MGIADTGWEIWEIWEDLLVCSVSELHHPVLTNIRVTFGEELTYFVSFFEQGVSIFPSEFSRL